MNPLLSSDEKRLAVFLCIAQIGPATESAVACAVFAPRRTVRKYAGELETQYLVVRTEPLSRGGESLYALTEDGKSLAAFYR